MRGTRRKHGDIRSKVPKLGPAVAASSVESARVNDPKFAVEIGKELNFNCRYVLSGDQREITQRVNNPVGRSVLEKRDRLPERIRHLLMDIALLCTGPYINGDAWGTTPAGDREKMDRAEAAHKRSQREEEDFAEAWNNLTEEDMQIDHYQPQFESLSDIWKKIIGEPIVNVRSESELQYFPRYDSIEARFGTELGYMFRMLYPGSSEGAPGSDLIWGFIMGFTRVSREDLSGQGDDDVERLINSFAQSHEKLKENNQLNIPMPNKNQRKKIPPFDDLMKEAIQETGITPHRIVLNEVEYHQVTSPDDGDLHKENAKSVVREITDITPLREVDQLADWVSNDLEEIQQRGKQGLECAQDVVKVLYKLETDQYSVSDPSDSKKSYRSTSKFIASELGEGVNVNQVTAVLNVLSKKQDSNLWTTTSLVERDTESERGSEHALTSYGAVVSHAAFECEAGVGWIYRYAIGPEELSVTERKMITEILIDLDLVDDDSPKYERL